MQEALRPPCRYGKYELVEHIGTGGMAEVYRARMPGIGGFSKMVVVKRLRPYRAADPDHRQMFIDEAKLAAKVQHQNVVQVFELERLEDDELYMTLEWVDGIDLKQLLKAAAKRGRPLPPWVCVSLVLQVLDALVFAHELRDEHGRRRNIVHCDVTPENIFVSRRGEVKLGDFGVALDDTRSTEIFEGQIKGKVPYLSPEQVNGERPDHRADVFSCGIVLWESLTLHRLFFAPTRTESMSRICMAPRTPPSKLAADIPKSLDRAVLRALEVDRAHRTASAFTMREELRALLDELTPNHGPSDFEEIVREFIEFQTKRPCSTPDAFHKNLSEALDALEQDDIDPVVDIDIADEEPTVAEDTPVPDYEDELAQRRLTSPSEGFTYSIIKPAHAVEAIPVIPMRGEAASVETGDLVRRTHESQSAPIAARPGNNNTEDILHRRSTVPPGSLFLRTPRQQTLGPLDALEVIGALDDLVEDGGATGVEISGDGRRWMPWERFGELLGDGIVPPSPVLPNNRFTGGLEDHSLASIFGQLTRTKATGRLILVRYGERVVDRREVHISDGMLTAVGSSRRPFLAWESLLRTKASGPYALAKHLQLVAQRAVPLADVAIDEVVRALAEARVRATRAAVEDIFGWDRGHFGFDPTAPLLTTMEPVPLLSTLPSAVAKAVPTNRLALALAAAMKTALTRTPDFDAEVRALGLYGERPEFVDAFGHGYTLGESIARCSGPSGDRSALVIGYLLVELGLLAPTIDAPTRHAQRS